MLARRVRGQLHEPGAFIDVDELQKAGINAADITKLRAAGVCTVLVRRLEE